MKFFQIAIVYFFYNGLLLLLLVRDMSGLIKRIQKADKNNDGEVTLAEFETAFGKGSLDEVSFWTRLKKGNLGLSKADTQIMIGRFVSSGLSSAVLRIWIATDLARLRPAMSWSARRKREWATSHGK